MFAYINQLPFLVLELMLTNILCVYCVWAYKQWLQLPSCLYFG